MIQNLVTLDLSAQDVAEFDQALAVIEKFVKPMVSLTADQKRELSKMGEKSEQFCRQAVMVLAQHRDVLPPPFPFSDLVGDLAAYDVLRPRALRLHDALHRLDDTLTALGSDVMVASAEGYTLMRMYGKAESLSLLESAMSVRRPGNRKPQDDTPD